MFSSADATRIILSALENLNAELGPERAVPVRSDTALFGMTASIDSLSLVSLIVDVETALSAEYGYDISLTDDRAMSRPVSPFTTVATLTDYVMELAGQRA